MERGEHYVLAAFAGGFDDASFHFTGGFVGEREAENVFAGEGIVGFEQVANALGDHARFSRPGAGDDEKRPVSMLNRPFLRRIHAQAG